MFGIHSFYATATLLNMLAMQLMQQRWFWGRIGLCTHGLNNVGGVTAGQKRHNSSNVGGVTAGQVGHNSSCNNTEDPVL